MDWGWKNHTRTQRRGGGAESREGGIWEPDLFFALHTVSLSLFKIPRQDLKDGKRRNKCIMHHDLFSFCFYLCFLSFSLCFLFGPRKLAETERTHIHTHARIHPQTQIVYLLFPRLPDDIMMMIMGWWCFLAGRIGIRMGVVVRKRSWGELHSVPPGGVGCGSM